MKAVNLAVPKRFIFSGYFGRPTYGQGQFTKGKVYEVWCIDFAEGEELMHLQTTIVVHDDRGNRVREEVTYFQEVTYEDYV